MAALSLATSVRLAAAGTMFAAVAAAVQVGQGSPCHARIDALALLALVFAAVGLALVCAGGLAEGLRRRAAAGGSEELSRLVALALVALAALSVALSLVAVRVGPC